MGFSCRWGPIPHISVSMGSPRVQVQTGAEWVFEQIWASLSAQLCCTAKVGQRRQPKAKCPPAWGVNEVSSVSSASHCPVELQHHPWRHCQNYSHSSYLVIATDPLAVCQTKEKCLMFRAKIFRISLLGINTRVTGQCEHWKVKRKPTQKKSRAKQTIFPFQRHLIKNQHFLQKFSIWLVLFYFVLFCLKEWWLGVY